MEGEIFHLLGRMLVGSIADRLEERRLKRRLREGLGRDVQGMELTSMRTWMEMPSDRPPSAKGAATGLIPTDSLRISDLPDPDATWGTIFEFARTFNGYEWAGGALECGDLAISTRKGYKSSPSHQVPSLALDELRACLFFEWRASAHSGEEPRGPDLLYIRALVKSILDGLSAGDAGGG